MFLSPTKLMRLLLLQGRSKTVKLLAVGILVSIASAAAWHFTERRPARRAELPTHTVRYDKLPLTIEAQGDLESAENSEVVCRVKRVVPRGPFASTIKWVVENGTNVKRGQLLVDLDDSHLQDALKLEKVFLEKALCDWCQAEENYKIEISRNQNAIQSAQIAVLLAELDYYKYLKGDDGLRRKDLQRRLILAESDAEQWHVRVGHSELMLRKGFISPNRADIEQRQLRSARISLDRLREERRLFEECSRKQMVIRLEKKLAEAKHTLERTKIQARAKGSQANIGRLSRRKIYQRRLDRCRELQTEIAKCRITAPRGGLVVYHIPDAGASSKTVLSPGEPVRTEQLLMRIPDLTQMQVKTWVHEAMVSRVRGDVRQPTGFGECVQAALMTTSDPLLAANNLAVFADVRPQFREQDHRKISEGQPVLVRIDAFPNRVLHGHVQEVATVPSRINDDWSANDVNVYETLITIDEPLEGLKPDMTARVTILVNEELDHVLTVPLEALVGTPGIGKQRKCFVLTAEGPEARAIVLGLHNDKLAEVRSGLRAGEKVVLHPERLVEESDKGERSDGAEMGATK